VRKAINDDNEGDNGKRRDFLIVLVLVVVLVLVSAVKESNRRRGR
jgi:hypothetical protein